MFAQLVRRPELVQQLRAELQRVTEGDALAPHHLPQLALLDAIIHETLRLFPPAPLMFRRCVTQHTLSVPAAQAFESKSAAAAASVPVPASAFVLCDIYGMQRRAGVLGRGCGRVQAVALAAERPTLQPSCCLPPIQCRAEELCRATVCIVRGASDDGSVHCSIRLAAACRAAPAGAVWRDQDQLCAGRSVWANISPHL